jgi:hypothetical protein
MPQTAMAASRVTAPSPLMLCDRLLALAMDADGAGYEGVANQLVRLAYRVLDRPAEKRPAPRVRR